MPSLQDISNFMFWCVASVYALFSSFSSLSIERSMHSAAKDFNHFIALISSLVFSNKLIMQVLSTIDVSLLQYGSVEVQTEIIRADYSKMRYGSVEAQEEMILADSASFEHASEELKRNAKLVRTLIARVGPSGLAWASPEVQDALIADGTVTLSELGHEMQQEFLSRHPEQLKDASIAVQQQLVRSHPELLLHASRAVQVATVKADFTKIRHIAIEDQRHIISEVPKSFEHAAAELRNDIDFVRSVAISDHTVMTWASPEAQDAIITEATVNLADMADEVQQEFLSRHPEQLKDASIAVQQHLVRLHPERLINASHKLQLEIIKLDDSMVQHASLDAQQEFIKSHLDHFQKASNKAQAAVIKAAPDLWEHGCKTVRDHVEVRESAPVKDYSIVEGAQKALKGKIIEVSAGRYKLLYAWCKLSGSQDIRMPEAIRDLEFKVSTDKYNEITIVEDIVTLKLTEEELCRDMLISLLSLPSQIPYDDSLDSKLACYKNKLNILSESHPYAKIIQRLASVMEREVKVLRSSSEPPQPIAADDSKFDVLIDELLLSRLASSTENVLEFINEQLKLLICKNVMPGMGGMDDFKKKISVDLEYCCSLRGQLEHLLNLDGSLYDSLGVFAHRNRRDVPTKKRISDIMEAISGLDQDSFLSLIAASLSLLKRAVLSANDAELTDRLKVTDSEKIVARLSYYVG